MFKNPNGGGWYTKGLFFEETGSDKSTVKFTLKNEDHQGYPSLYKLYIETGDPTEYIFATTYLGGWDHWQTLCASHFFKPYVEAWRKELEVKMKAEALVRIMSEASDGGRNSFNANKYLLEKGWKEEPEKRGRGRPSKEDIRNRASEIVDADKRITQDFQRLLSN